MNDQSRSDNIEQFRTTLKELSERIRDLEAQLEQFADDAGEEVAAADISVSEQKVVKPEIVEQPVMPAAVAAGADDPNQHVPPRVESPTSSERQASPSSLATPPKADSGWSSLRRDTASFEAVVGGRWLTWAGAFTMLVAIAFFIPWAWHYFDVPAWLKVLAMHLASFLGLGFGLWIHHRGLKFFGQTVIGLSLFAWYGIALAALWTFDFYQVIFGHWENEFTTIECTVITLVAIFLAVRLDGIGIVLIGAFGGYLNPILTSSGEGNCVELFLYLAFLNVAMVVSDVIRRWNTLKLLALIATIFMFFFWVNDATHLEIWPLEWLAVLHLAIFWAAVTVPPLALRRTTHEVDLVVLGGSSIGYMGLTWYLFHSQSHVHYLGLLCGGLALVHAVLFLTTRLRVTDEDHMPRTNLALAVLFLTLIAPMQLQDFSYLAMAWSFEGLALMAIGLFYADRQMLIATMIVFLLASGRLFFWDTTSSHDTRVWLIGPTELLFVISSAIMLVSGSMAWWVPRRGQGVSGGPLWKPTPTHFELGVAAFALALGNLLLLTAIVQQWWPGRIVLVLWTLDLLVIWLTGLWLRIGPVRWYAVFIVTPLVFICAAVMGSDYHKPFQLIFNSRFGSLTLLAVAAFLVSWGYRRAGSKQALPSPSSRSSWPGDTIGTAESLLQYVTGFFGCLVVFNALNLEIDTWFEVAQQRATPPFKDMWTVEMATYSIVWTVLAAAIVVGGFLTKSRFYRLLGLLAFVPILLKVFLVDLSQLHQLARVLATFALGATLLGVSFLYQKITVRLSNEEPHDKKDL